MSDRIAAVAGLDVHKLSTRIAAVRGDRLVCEVTVASQPEVVERELRRLRVVACCYEAGPTGFDLARHLNAVGIDCQVVAPGLVWRQPGDRVKTDPRDARRLAAQYAGGMLEPIFVPSRELEGLRDLVRAREDARQDRSRTRLRLSAFVLRHGRYLPTKSWSVQRRAWLGQQRFDAPGAQAAFDDYVAAVDLVDRRVELLERQLGEQAVAGPHAELVARLRCLRGIDTLSAVGITAEIGDFARFATAQQFMSFVGLVPSERSSGERRRLGSITKAGNDHVRRLLVEAAWNHRRRPAMNYLIQRRRRDQAPLAVERAIRAEQRLHRRWIRLRGRGKDERTIVVAVARELAGFVWAIATEQPLKPITPPKSQRTAVANPDDALNGPYSPSDPLTKASA
jgi:transposase